MEIITSSQKFHVLICTTAVQSDLRGKSVRAAALTWLTGMFDFALRIGSTAVLARLLLPDQFGVVMMVTAVTAIAEQFKDLGLSTATVQRKEITFEEVTNLFWINVAAGTLMALLVCASAPLISSYYKDSRLTPVTCALALNFIFGGLMVQHQALLTRRLQLGTTSMVRFLSSLISTGLAILLAVKGFSYWSLVWREVSRAFLLTFGMWLCLPWVPRFPFWGQSVRSLMRFGVDLSAANIAATLTAGMDRFLLGRFWGANAVGFYRQAYQLLIVPVDQLLSPVYNVAQPGLSMLQNDPPRFRQFYRKVLTVICFVTMPLCVFVAVYSPEITHVLLGANWNSAAPVLMILSISAFVRQPIGSAAFILITRGNSRVYLKVTLAQIVVGVVSLCIGVRWGIIGVAMADVAATYLMLFPRLHFCLKGSPFLIGDFLRAMVRPVAASAALAMALLALHLTLPLRPLPGLVVAVLTALIVFPGIWLLLPGGQRELFGILGDLQVAWKRKEGKARATAPSVVAAG
jgi:PST family polysaccharide transporter